MNFYLSHMTPGERHYLSVDYDDSFGFTTDNSAPCKWVLEPAESTGITNVDTNKSISKVTYVNMMGIESETPYDGVNIVVTKYNDGSMTTGKMIR